MIIDIMGNGFALTGQPGGVHFDINGDGQTELIPWTAAYSDDVWLFLDRNGNATVDSGIELFGNVTPQPYSGDPNGFIALAGYDRPEKGGNSDGRINNRDAVFSSLRLWQDANHNGVSEASELFILPALNVAAIETRYKESKRRDQYGNEFRYRAKVFGADGAQLGRWAYDVYLVAGRATAHAQK